MKKLKDVTVNLKGVDQKTIDDLFNFASAFSNEYDIWVTDPGYDLVRDDEGKGSGAFFPTTSDETPLEPTPKVVPALQYSGPIILNQRQMDHLIQAIKESGTL